MKFILHLGIIIGSALNILAHPTDSHNETLVLEERGSCANAAGECVTYYSGEDCSGPLGSYVPDCTGNCFQYSSFSSLHTVGRTILPAGTDCVIYSDSNCQNEIADTGNHIPTECTSFSEAQSMQCYFNC